MCILENMSYNRAYSLVVDLKGEYLLQAKRLIWSLVHYISVPKNDIYLFYVNNDDEKSLELIRSLEVNAIEIQRSSINGYCNKLQRFPYLTKLIDIYDDFVLLDCDVVVTGNLPINNDAVQAKIVDYANPPFDKLKKIFESANISYIPTKCSLTDDQTIHGNMNGGLYIIPTKFANDLFFQWRRWADWCFENNKLFESYTIHIDQVSFALAINYCQIRLCEIPLKYNFPTHVRVSKSEDCDPHLLHYHRAIDKLQLLLQVDGLDSVNKTINKVNMDWNDYYQQHFDNVSFWNARYKLFPDLGSGVGSRGDKLLYKQHLLQQICQTLDFKAILDLGGGDGETISILRDESKICLDISKDSKEHYIKNNPTANWKLFDISSESINEKADLAICFDVLIHQPNEQYFDNVIKHICKFSGFILVNGYDCDPYFKSSIIYFYQPLKQKIISLDRLPILVGNYNATNIYLIIPKIKSENTRNIRVDTLTESLPYVQNKILLAKSIFKSQSTFGFFPDHLPRCIEYPWILDILKNESNMTILDAGAGISCIPIILAEKGHHVITVDNYHQDRSQNVTDCTNTEWGFINYNNINKNIISINMAFENISNDIKIDAFISTSVIEHLSNQIRKLWIQKCGFIIKTGGFLLLTVDTELNSDKLWNYCEGKIVEDWNNHGNLNDLLSEISNNNFKIKCYEKDLFLPKSKVGMVRICAVKL